MLIAKIDGYSNWRMEVTPSEMISWYNRIAKRENGLFEPRFRHVCHVASEIFAAKKSRKALGTGKFGQYIVYQETFLSTLKERFGAEHGASLWMNYKFVNFMKQHGSEFYSDDVISVIEITQERLGQPVDGEHYVIERLLNRLGAIAMLQAEYPDEPITFCIRK